MGISRDRLEAFGYLRESGQEEGQAHNWWDGRDLFRSPV